MGKFLTLLRSDDKSPHGKVSVIFNMGQVICRNIALLTRLGVYFSAFVGKSWPKVHDFSEKQGDFLSKAADFFRKVAEFAKQQGQAKSFCGAKATTSASSSGVSPRCTPLPPAFAMLAALMHRPLGNNLRDALHFRRQRRCFVLGQEEKQHVLCRNPPK